MEKASSGVMDLDEWEILHDDGFLGFHRSDGQGFYPRKLGFDSRFTVDMDYFICPPPPTRPHLHSTDNSKVAQGRRNKLVPVPVRLEPMVEENPNGKLVKDIREVPVVEIRVAEEVGLEKMKDPNWVPDQDTISQVFFKKMKENEFVDMKMDSPRSSCRGLKTQIELGAIQFEEEDEEEGGCKGEDLEQKPEEVEIETERGESFVGQEMEEKAWWVGGGLNIWRWKVTGIGALCSMGVAAAAICIFIFGSHQRQKQHENQKRRFQIYADDQSIKHVVHHATRLNQTLASVRVPLARAHITFGGYYEGL